ncbi:MAG: DUF5317 domain-containing protein [Actinomycetia bacterium]|nr:DUF5317 domain-containing protein [Actinomycetes bacterium]
MTLLVLAIAVGFVARRLSGTTDTLPVLAWPAVPLLAIGVQIFNQVTGLGWTAVMVASHALVTVWAVAIVCRQSRAARIGMSIVAVGFVLNLLPVAANGNMPVSESAAVAVGFKIDESIETGHLAKHRIARDGDRLLLLSDTIAVPWLRAVVSIGDLVMALGIVLAIRPIGLGSRRRKPVVEIMTDKPCVSQ